MEWLNSKLVSGVNWLKCKIQPVRLWICNTIGCSNSTSCGTSSKIETKTKIKLRKKAKKKGK